MATTSQEQSAMVSPAAPRGAANTASDQVVTATASSRDRTWALVSAALGGIIVGVAAAVAVPRLVGLNVGRAAPVIQGSRNFVISLPFSGVSLTQTSHERQRPAVRGGDSRTRRWWRQTGVYSQHRFRRNRQVHPGRA
jgi:hypothetical protein